MYEWRSNTAIFVYLSNLLFTYKINQGWHYQTHPSQLGVSTLMTHTSVLQLISAWVWGCLSAVQTPSQPSVFLLWAALLTLTRPGRGHASNSSHSSSSNATAPWPLMQELNVKFCVTIIYPSKRKGSNPKKSGFMYLTNKPFTPHHNLGGQDTIFC